MSRSVSSFGVCSCVAALQAWGAWLRVCSGAAQKPAYTTEEYNAYIKAHNETDPQQKLVLDDFVASTPIRRCSSTSITTTTRLITR